MRLFGVRRAGDPKRILASYTDEAGVVWRLKSSYYKSEKYKNQHSMYLINLHRDRGVKIEVSHPEVSGRGVKLTPFLTPESILLSVKEPLKVLSEMAWIEILEVWMLNLEEARKLSLKNGASYWPFRSMEDDVILLSYLRKILSSCTPDECYLAVHLLLEFFDSGDPFADKCWPEVSDFISAAKMSLSA